MIYIYRYMYMFIYVCIYIYTYAQASMFVYIYIYIYIYDRERVQSSVDRILCRGEFGWRGTDLRSPSSEPRARLRSRKGPPASIDPSAADVTPVRPESKGKRRKPKSPTSGTSAKQTKQKTLGMFKGAKLETNLGPTPLRNALAESRHRKPMPWELATNLREWKPRQRPRGKTQRPLEQWLRQDHHHFLPKLDQLSWVNH